MKEITGELWDYYGKPNHVVCITTNATLKKDKSIVMGRGCALEAKRRDPALPYLLGDQVFRHGNVPVLVTVTGRDLGYFCSFPVKHNYWEVADLELIAQSAAHLKAIADKHPEMMFILPRPGCGNGRRTWEEVKPLLASLPDNVWVIRK